MEINEESAIEEFMSIKTKLENKEVSSDHLKNSPLDLIPLLESLKNFSVNRSILEWTRMGKTISAILLSSKDAQVKNLAEQIK